MSDLIRRSAASIDAVHTAVNYTPVQVGSENVKRVSAHLKGIDSALRRNAETITVANTFAAGNVIRRTTGAYALSKGDTAANVEAIGIVESASGTAFTVVYEGPITVAGAGWTDGEVYRVSSVTSGLLTSDASPSATWDKPLLIATGATTGIVLTGRANLVEYSGQLQSLGYYKPAISVGQTAFTTPWNYETGANRLWIWRNGILQVITTDFVETNSNTVTLTAAITESDEEIIILRMPNGEVPLLRSVEANTAGSGSPNVLSDQESSKVLTNEGATAKNYHTLPAATAGMTYTFYCQDTDGIRITAGTGDTIRIVDQVSAAAGYAESTSVGSTVTLVAINTTEWVAIAALGSWTII